MYWPRLIDKYGERVESTCEGPLTSSMAFSLPGMGVAYLTVWTDGGSDDMGVLGTLPAPPLAWPLMAILLGTARPN